jgi:GntR family transcriptional repressor for pyruvate dehydrogenase complex
MTLAVPRATDGVFTALSDRRIFEEILRQLEEAVLVGRLKEGDRLPPERELATTFNVGRSTLREALRALEMLGVVSTRRGAGSASGSFIVASAPSAFAAALRFQAALRKIPVEDFVDLRLVLESLVVERAAARSSDIDIDGLRDLVQAMRDAATPAEFHEYDAAFHVQLAVESGNGLIPVFMEALRGALSREMVRASVRLPDWQGEKRLLIEEHEAIIRALAAGDAVAAVAEIRSHITRFYARAPASTTSAP